MVLYIPGIFFVKLALQWSEVDFPLYSDESTANTVQLAKLGKSYDNNLNIIIWL